MRSILQPSVFLGAKLHEPLLQVPETADFTRIDRLVESMPVQDLDHHLDVLAIACRRIVERSVEEAASWSG